MYVQSTILKLRAFYLATGLSSGILVPYLSILLKTDGFESGTVGLVMAIGTAVSIITQPLWGIAVDRFRMTRLTLAMSAVFPGLLAVIFDVDWLWIIVLANMIWNIFASPQAPISDAYAVTNAARTGASYGSIRLFGSLGFAIGGFLSGEYLNHFSITTIWIPYTVMCLIAGCIPFLLPKNDVDFVGTGSLAEGIFSLLKNPSFVVFLAGGFLVSQTLTAFNTYFSLTFQAMGGSMALTGVAFFVASGTNVPAMLVGRYVTIKLGRERTLVLASFAYVLRWLIQAYVPIPWVSIAIQVLHGVSFGFYYIAAVDFVFKSAGKQLQATAQSIFGMICSGLAGIVGNLLNGYLLRFGGPELMYSVCMISSLLGGLCFWFVCRRANSKHQHAPLPAPPA